MNSGEKPKTKLYCLTPGQAKIYLKRKKVFSPAALAHIEKCPECQQAIKEARTDLAWHSR